MKYQTIQNYVLWRGDLTFAQDGFRLLDSFVLCQICYVNFQPAGLIDGSTMTLREAGQIILDNHAYELKNLYGGYQDFFEIVIQSKRFGDLKIHSYVDSFDKISKLQFSAMIFEIGNHERFIAYRGTDDSLTGWKEDFMLSFTKIPSQYYAEEYLRMHVEEGYSYRIGGHSKGGNLCVYAMAQLPREKQELISHVYDLDGPGFCSEILDIEHLQSIQNKLLKVTPSFSIISRIYEVTVNHTIIIHADAIGLDQHDLMNWNIEYLQPMEMNDYDAVSTWLIHTIMEWAYSTPIKQRELFVNEVFDALHSSGIEHFQDINLKDITKVIQAMAETNPEAKKIALNLAKTAIGLNKGNT